MISRPFGDLKLSALGLGTMRLPLIEGTKEIDEKQTAAMIATAMEKGINYYDTAWRYHGGASEPTVGNILSAYPRESFFLASKFPGYDAENHKHMAEIFEQQLKRCRTPYFDFYLIHSVSDEAVPVYLSYAPTFIPYLLEQKKNGRIRHLGFSVHANNENMQKFLAVYGPYMEFAQVQLNYMDWHYQKAKEKLAILEQRHLPIFVMEPLRGGRLATLPPRLWERLSALRPTETPCSFAFRFLQSIPAVAVTLSGMSNMKQLEDNIKTFEEEKPLTPAETEVLFSVAEALVKDTLLPCTACRYCVEKCPKGLDIPHLLDIFNHDLKALSAVDEAHRPSSCIGCRSCEKVCPQGIQIAGAMSYFAAKMR